MRPDDDDPQLCLPFVSVQVNGVDVEALLDSGAARSQFVERPGMAMSPTAEDSTGALGGPLSATGTAVVSMRLAGADVGPVSVAVVPAGLPGPGNLIGQDVLGRFRCTYRLAERVLTLDPEPPDRTHPIYMDEKRHVYFDATWEGVDVLAGAVFDTGASVTVVDRRFAQLHPDLFRPAGSSAGMDASGQSVETPMAIMRGPRLLGEQLADALVAVVDLGGANRLLSRPMDLILGWTTLSQASWYVDHRHSRAAWIPFR